MSGTPPDLSTYKPVAGGSIAAMPIANAMTAIETWATNAIDPASMLQKAATIGQALVWDGTKWGPGDSRYPTAPTLVGPTLAPIGGGPLTANTAYLFPVAVTVPTTITRLAFYVTGGGGTGNVDAGVYYSDDDATFTRLVSKGSTATPAAGAAALTVGATTLTPVAGRRWYLAFAASSATPNFADSIYVVTASFQKATSFPLPASLTGMTSPAALAVYMYGLV